MPPAIDSQIKGQVIKEWLYGKTRDEIAKNNGIGAGTVSNIINEWREGVDRIEYEKIRELALFSKREEITLSDLASHVRLINHIKRLGADFGQIESFIANIADSQEPQKLVETANQIAQLSTSDSIPLDMMNDHIKRQQDELQRIKEEIEKAGAILEQKNVDIQTIDEYKKLEEELNIYNLTMESPRKLVSILHTINEMGYDTQKIVAGLARLKSLKHTERQLKKGCEILENRATRYKEIIPLCEQITRLGIRFPELVAFHAAVMKKSDSDKLPMPTAAYRVMEDIENYDRLGGLKDEIFKLIMQKYTIEQMCMPRNMAISALVNLQSYGITDQEILSACEFLNRARLDAVKIMQNPFVSSQFKSENLNSTHNGVHSLSKGKDDGGNSA